MQVHGEKVVRERAMSQLSRLHTKDKSWGGSCVGAQVDPRSQNGIPLDRCRTIDRAHFFFFFCPALLLVVGGVEGELEASEGLHSAVNVTGMVLFDANVAVESAHWW